MNHLHLILLPTSSLGIYIISGNSSDFFIQSTFYVDTVYSKQNKRNDSAFTALTYCDQLALSLRHAYGHQDAVTACKIRIKSTVFKIACRNDIQIHLFRFYSVTSWQTSTPWQTVSHVININQVCTALVVKIIEFSKITMLILRFGKRRLNFYAPLWQNSVQRLVRVNMLISFFSV